MSILLRQVRLLDPVSETDRVTDVLVGNGVIEAIAPDSGAIAFDSDLEILECQGWVLGPGLVDLYSHCGEPGNESRETLVSLLQAGAAGGFTRLAILPDTDPAIDDPAVVQWFQSKHRPAPRNPMPTLHLWAALTRQAQGQQMSELWELAETGIVGFADGHPIRHSLLLQRILEYAQPLDKPIALWCCDTDLRGNGVVRLGQEAMRLGLPGVGAIAETAPLAALLELVEALGTPVHLMRVSTARSVELIARAKARGLPITASTPWMHLLLDITAVQTYDPQLRLEPPLGNPEDRAALVAAVRDGVIEAIAIDHTPYTYEEKTVPFAEAPPGAIGLELALPLLWQSLVVSGEWSALTLWRALSTNPALCLGQVPALVQPDQPTELTLFNPQHPWTVTPAEVRSRSANTPWLGQTLTGRVQRIWTPAG